MKEKKCVFKISTLCSVQQGANFIKLNSQHFVTKTLQTYDKLSFRIKSNAETISFLNTLYVTVKSSHSANMKTVELYKPKQEVTYAVLRGQTTAQSGQSNCDQISDSPLRKPKLYSFYLITYFSLMNISWLV